MKSMTGFGKAELERDGYKATIEIKTINNRYFDFNAKMPKTLFYLEDKLRKIVSTKISRGRVDIFISLERVSEAEKNISVNEEIAKAYVDAGALLVEKLGVKNDITCGYLLRTNDVLKIEDKEEDQALIEKVVLDATKQAVKNIEKMRAKEGNNLKKDVLKWTLSIEETLDKVKQKAPTIQENYREKLNARIKEILADTEIDEAKLLNEVAFFADKSNIDEEMTRLTSHIEQFRLICEEKEPVGRKLDFLIQEFNRESNTICSKANDIEITKMGLSLKGDIEKIREQIQNIE